MPGKLRVGRSADLGDRTFFFEIIPDLLLIAGFDGYMRDVNTAWQNAVGWSRNELLAIPFLEFIHPEDRTRMAAEMERVHKGIFMMFLESRFQCKDGTYKWFMWKAAGMPGRSKAYLLGREIVPGKDAIPRVAAGSRSESAADRRGGHLDLVQEWLGAGSWEIDLASLRFWWSDGLARLLGYSPSECPATSQAATELVAPGDRSACLAAVRAAMDEGQAQVRFAARQADGTMRPMRGIVRCARDRDGIPKTLFGAVQPLEAPGEAPGAPAPQASPPDAAADPRGPAATQ